jgi:outer membrane receptor protein involved in Fe transport
MRHSFRLLTFPLICVLVMGSSAWSQSARARILGRVLDPQGAVVAGANITVTNTQTGVESHTVTASDGTYQVLELPIGSYKVEANKLGFTKSVTPPYTLEINQAQRVDLTLAVGAESQIVEVNASSATVETVNPTLGATVASRPIVNLPLNGRNVLDLALLQPGVTPTNDDNSNTSAGTFNISGGRSDSVTYLLDGGINNNLLSNGVVYNPNPDAVAEFRVLTSNYTAEYGRNSGGIISVVTKSGTNGIHGSAFEFLRNDALNANSYFNKQAGAPRDVLKRNQYGGTVGGPFVKDKVFWFASYQGQRLSAIENNGIQTVPTPAMLQGDFSGLPVDQGSTNPVADFLQTHPFFQPDPAKAAQGIIDPTKFDPVAKAYLSNNLLRSNPSGSILASDTATDNYNELTGKLDVNLTTNDHINATLGMRRRPQLIPLAAGPGFPSNTINRNYFLNIGYTKTFSPTLLNDFRFTASRNFNNQAIPSKKLPIPSALGITGITPDNATGPTRLDFSSGLAVGFSLQGPTTLIDNTFAWQDTFTWVKGKHTWKFGGSYIPYQNNTVFDFFVNGEFFFADGTGFGAGNQFANFLLGIPDEYTQFGAAPSNIRSKAFYGFAQDEWHVRDNLTFTLGARYEYSTPKRDTQGRSFALIPGLQSTRFPNAPTGLVFPGDRGAPNGANFPDKNDWAPRFGFAWDPFHDHKTSVRGGIGLFYDILKGEDNLQYNGQAPFFGFADLFFPEDPADIPNGPTNFLAQPFDTTGSANPFPSRPPAQNIDFDAAGFLPFGGGGVFFVNPNLRTPYTYQYNMSLQRELGAGTTLELGYVGSTSHKLTGLVDHNPFVPGTDTRLLNQNATNFSYLVQFDNVGNSNYNALEASLNKKLTRLSSFGNLYYTLAYTWSHSIDNISGFRNRNSQVPTADHNLYRANSDFDVRHKLSFSAGWDLPFDQLAASAPKRLVGGWSLYPIVTFRTGFPLDIFSSEFNGRTRPGPSGLGDAGVVHAQQVGPFTRFDPHTQTTVAGASANFLFDPTGFADPDPNCGCGYGVARNFFTGPHRTNVDLAIAKTTPLIGERLKMEFRTEFFNIFNTAQFRTVDTNISSNTFGQVTSTYDPRIIQFGVRFTF